MYPIKGIYLQMKKKSEKIEKKTEKIEKKNILTFVRAEWRHLAKVHQLSQCLQSTTHLSAVLHLQISRNFCIRLIYS